MPASRRPSLSAGHRVTSALRITRGEPRTRLADTSAAAEAMPEQRTGERPPRHLITETRDWARILLAAGTAIAAVITAIGQVIGRLS